LNSIPDEGGINTPEAPASQSAERIDVDGFPVEEHLEAYSSRIEELVQQIELMEERDLDRIEKARLRQLKNELRVATIISRQLERTSLTKENSGDKKAEEDSFVIAQIAVPAGSDVADITFTTLTGETAASDRLFDFVRETPEGGYHDYRIVSRHPSFGTAEVALQNVRAEYDSQMEREAQILAYIAERNRQLNALRSARRC
ncbi:MAG: hypothetical protein AAF456_08780, partial [Planctomycetota bacterium]